MVLFNYSTKELTAKVVYYGPGLCGKTTNLQWIHEKIPIKNKGKMLSLATEADRTLFFDFRPIELGTIRGMKTRIQLYTVPGQVFYNATRRMVLKGADCVVFVVDSQEPMLEASLDALLNLRENLEVNEIDPDELPMVMQYNKRDLPNALPVEILNERLNPKNLPFYEAVAMKGVGVEETLKGVTALVFRSLASRYGSPETPAPGPSRGAAAAASLPAPRVAAPPLAAGPAGDDLLASLDLSLSSSATQPPESMEISFEEEEVSISDELATLSADDLTPVPPLDLPPPAPRPPARAPEPRVVRPAAPPAPPAASVDSRTTLIRTSDDADDLRRRIGRRPEPEVTLEELEEEEEGEALSVAAGPLASPLLGEAHTSPRLATPLPFPVAPALSVSAAHVKEATVLVPIVTRTGATPAEVVVPIEVTVPPGVSDVQIHLRITIKVKAPS